MRDLRLRAVCSSSKVGKTAENADRVIDAIDRAATDGVDIVCFPEMCLTGYAMPRSRDFSMPLDSEVVGAVVDRTGESGICACFGLMEDGPYITQVVAENGAIAGTYRKTHLGGRESPVAKAGSRLDVIRTSRAIIGIQLCWESHIPEITGTYATKGADIVLMPHASGLSPVRRCEGWEKVLPARAYDNTVYVAACNMVGDNGLGTVFGGGACILDPRGNMLTHDYSGECEVTADLTSEALDSIRHGDRSTMRNLYFLEKRRPELYYR